MYKDLILEQQKLKKEAYISLKDSERLDDLDSKYKEIFIKINKKDIEAINENKTNVFVFHNHNMAYYCWKKAFLDGKIGKGNLLLHFDSHRDLKIPGKKELEDFDKQESLEKYAAEKLWITDFIFPAIKEEIIDEVVWVEPEHMELGIGPKLLKKVFFDVERVGFSLKEGIPITTIRAEDILDNIKDKKILLDIDIDYFSCTENPKNIVSEEEIKENIEKLFLILKNIKPEIVTIALSPDYVPYEQIEFISGLLIKKLEEN
jgi:hypothetical protein